MVLKKFGVSVEGKFFLSTNKNHGFRKSVKSCIIAWARQCIYVGIRGFKSLNLEKRMVEGWKIEVLLYLMRLELNLQKTH